MMRLNGKTSVTSVIVTLAFSHVCSPRTSLSIPTVITATVVKIPKAAVSG